MAKICHKNIKLEYVPEKQFSRNFFWYMNIYLNCYEKSFVKIASREHILILYFDEKFWPYLSENVKMGEFAQL